METRGIALMLTAPRLESAIAGAQLMLVGGSGESKKQLLYSLYRRDDLPPLGFLLWRGVIRPRNLETISSILRGRPAPSIGRQMTTRRTFRAGSCVFLASRAINVFHQEDLANQAELPFTRTQAGNGVHHEQTEPAPEEDPTRPFLDWQRFITIHLERLCRKGQTTALNERMRLCARFEPYPLGAPPLRGYLNPADGRMHPPAFGCLLAEFVNEDAAKKAAGFINSLSWNVEPDGISLVEINPVTGEPLALLRRFDLSDAVPHSAVTL